jgi:hypothetical protein
MVQLLCIHVLQYRYNDSQQLFWVLEGLHIEIHSTAFRVQSVQLTPADIACREGRNSERALWSFYNHALSLSLIETISRLTRCWSLAVGLIENLDSGPVHALQILLYSSIDLVLGVPTRSSLAQAISNQALYIPLHDVHEQSTRSTLYRFHDNLVFGSHGGVGKLQRVEVEHAVQDFVCGNWSAMHQHAQGIESCRHN